MGPDKNILIIGIGNTLRSDDGIGAYVCYCINKLHLPLVNTMIIQQLDTALIDEWIENDAVVLVDAAVLGKPVSFYPALKNNSSPAAVSHQINANVLASLIQQLYKKNLQIMVCAVRGYNFDMGEQLSATAIHHANDAVNTITNWIKNNSY